MKAWLSVFVSILPTLISSRHLSPLQPSSSTAPVCSRGSGSLFPPPPPSLRPFLLSSRFPSPHLSPPFSLSPLPGPRAPSPPPRAPPLSPLAVSLMPSLIQPTTSRLFWGQEMQVPGSSLLRLRGPLSPVPPARRGWNPNWPLGPLLVAASPGTCIFLFPSLRMLSAQPQ